jgi:predicted RecA/RadA family phage recombinase
MSTTYIQSGDVLTMPAPTGGVTAGTPILIGTKVMIPRTTAAEAADADFHVGGVHKVTKAGSQAWTIGAAVYWDDTAKDFTTTSSGNTAAGIAVEAVGSGSGETSGKILLNGIPG